MNSEGALYRFLFMNSEGALYRFPFMNSGGGPLPVSFYEFRGPFTGFLFWSLFFDFPEYTAAAVI